MPKKSKTLCVDDLRHAEYYGMQDTFDELYQKSQNGIRLLTVIWPDRDHAPHAGQFFTLRAWGADEAPFLSRPISVHRWNPDSSTIEFLYQVVGECCRENF